MNQIEQCQGRTQRLTNETEPLSSKLVGAIRQQLAANSERLKAYYADGASTAKGAPSCEDAVRLRGANAALLKVLRDCGIDEPEGCTDQ